MRKKPLKYLSIPLPIPFFKHPSIVRSGLKYKTLFSLSRISYFFNMCHMSQPQFLLFPPKSDRGLHYDPVQDSVQFYYVSYFFNMCYVPTPVQAVFPSSLIEVCIMILFKTLFSFILYHISSNHGLVLSHVSPFVDQNISPPTQYAVSFIGSPF